MCALAVSATSPLLASAEEGTGALIRLWRLEDGACLSLLHGEGCCWYRRPGACLWPDQSNDGLSVYEVPSARAKGRTEDHRLVGTQANSRCLATPPFPLQCTRFAVRANEYYQGLCWAVGVDCGLACLDISSDGSALLAVGKTARKQPLLVLWDISNVHSGALSLCLPIGQGMLRCKHLDSKCSGGTTWPPG